MYDTEQATLLFVDEMSRRKRMYYQTNKGNYFCLYTNGVITPLEEEDVKTILGQLDVDRYIELFDEPDYA